MKKFAQAIIYLGRSISRLAIAVEKIEKLYRLELQERFNIREYDPKVKDITEVSYSRSLVGRDLDQDDLP